MRHLTATIADREQLAALLAQEAARSAAREGGSVLAQVFVGRPDVDWIRAISGAIRAAIPDAVVVGATSAGEIEGGRVALDSTVVSLSVFESSKLHPIAVERAVGREYDTGSGIADRLARIDHLQGVLLIAPPITLRCAQLLEGFQDRAPGSVVFGGGAAAVGEPARSLVFLGDQILDDGGVVAVGLAGERLHLSSHAFLGWKPLGRRMTLTGVSGSDILTIDGMPAFDAYRKYLSLQPGDDLFLLEFPLLIERHEALLARNPISAGADGRVSLVADVRGGETARLGYLDIDAVIEQMRSTRSTLADFGPEAIYLYSCICRRFSLQQDVELETRPFQELAPTAGFFTYGEFCRSGDRLQLLNSSQVVVALREGLAQPKAHAANGGLGDEADRYRVRHIRITSRLFHFIGALTEEVEEANRAFQHQAERDPLTGALNRRVLERDLEAEVRRSSRHGHRFSIVMFDLDHFKAINDRFGHASGDRVLQAIAGTVLSCVRANDRLYRYGGEEFLLLLPETSQPAAGLVGEKLRSAIQALTLESDAGPLPGITASFGVAAFPEQGNLGRAVVSAADEALYFAKQHGRNRVTLASEGPKAGEPGRG